MKATVFIGSGREGATRAECRDGAWAVEPLLAGIDVRCIAQDPHHPDTLLAGTQGQGLLRSQDRGRTWNPAGLDGQIVKSVAFSPSQPGMVVLGTKPPLVYASYDGGETWEELAGFRKIPSRPFWRSPAEPPGTAYVQALAISPTDPNVIVAGIEAGAVVRTADGGKTWPGHRRGSVRDCHSLIFHHSDGQYAYEAGGVGIGAALSRDGGETWEQPRHGMDRHYGWAVAADPERPTVWYVSAAPGPRRAHSARAIADAYIFRSVEGGPWEKLGGGLPQPIPHMPYALLTDPAAPGHVYAGLANGDIWHSADHGDTWAQLPLNLTGGIQRTLVMLT